MVARRWARRPPYGKLSRAPSIARLETDSDIIARMGELEPWIDEGFVRQVWFNLGEQVNVKMIRDKFSG